MKKNQQIRLSAVGLFVVFSTAVASANVAFAFARSGFASNLAGWSTTPNTNPNMIPHIWPPLQSPSTVNPISAGTTWRNGSLLLNADGRVFAAGPIDDYGNLGGVAAGPGAFIPTLSNIIQLEDGYRGFNGFGPYYVYALRADGKMIEWSGPASLPPSTSSPPVVIPGNANNRIKQFAVSEGAVYCLTGSGGLVYRGQTSGIGSTSPTLAFSTIMQNTATLKGIAAGRSHGAGLASDGTIYTWGDASSNASSKQVDAGSGGYTGNTPYHVTAALLGGRAKLVACGHVSTYALLSNGTVRYWGNGKTGIATVMTAPGIQLQHVKHIWAGREAAFFLRADGVVFALGAGAAYQVGAGPWPTTPPNYPTLYAVPVELPGHATSSPPLSSGVVAGGGANPVIFIRGTGRSQFAGTAPGITSSVMASRTPTAAQLPAPYGMWRWAQYRRTGMGIDVHGRAYVVGTFPSFASIPSVPAIDVTCSDKMFVILGADGIPYFFGSDILKMFGGSVASPTAMPLPVGRRALKVKLCEADIFVLADDGTVWHRGFNKSTNSGTGAMGPITTPVWAQVLQGTLPLIKLEHVTDISCGETIGMALKASGDVYVWGTSQMGQLGSGSSSTHTMLLIAHQIPVLQPNGGFETVKQIASGLNHCLALTATGRAYGWGSNSYGQLATTVPVSQYSDRAHVLSSGELAGQDTKQIAAGHGSTYLLKANGQIQSCGNPAGGRLGRGGSPSALGIVTGGLFESLGVEYSSELAAAIAP